MKILRLTAENIKRLSVVEIQPDGSPVIVIGGKNGAGKSSVLDSIAMALGGADLIPGRPVRAGQTKAKVQVDLGDLIVTRTFTEAGGGTLVVANKDGARYPSPQAMLDKLIGRLSFDPLEFERMPPKQQRDTLRALVGLDTTGLDSDIKALYDERTVINRQVKQQEGQLAGMALYKDAPTEPISLSSLSAELEAADQTRELLDVARRAYEAQQAVVDGARRMVERHQADAAGVRRRIAELQRQLSDVETSERAALAQLDTDEQALEETREQGAAAKAALIDHAPIRERIKASEMVNAKVRANAGRVAFEAGIEQQRKASKALSEEIGKLEAEKQARLAGVTFPVPGLSISDDGVTMNDLPFEQASQAQRLRASVAIGLALNPKLKVLLVREGSALDSDSMKLLAELAADADAQVWLERVAESKDGVSVLIEDGAVKQEEVAVS